MKEYIMETVSEKHIDGVIEIYNSNPIFLKAHLDRNSISREFVETELRQMKEMGFNSIAIRDGRNKRIIAFCDYKLDTTVYLSLLMLHGNNKGKGLGKLIYADLENLFLRQGAENIRIDVVWDYEENVTDFWKKQGFKIEKDIELNWNEKISKAFKMVKKLPAEGGT